MLSAVRDGKLIQFLQSANNAKKTIASVCTGSFILAQAGLLNNRQCTTHWSNIDELRNRFPDAKVLDDCISTNHGHIWTSGGATTGIDMVLAMIEKDYSATISTQVARELALFAARPAKHNQSSQLLDIAPDTCQRLKDVFLHVRAKPQDKYNLAGLASLANMSERTFSHHCQDEFGVSPARLVRKIRTDRARELLENTEHNAKQIARLAGFSNVNAMRRNLGPNIHAQ